MDHPFRLAEGGHYGLLGMRERTELHDGWLRVEGEPKRGTTITAWLAAPSAPPVVDADLFLSPGD